MCAKRGDARESLSHALHATTLDATREESHRTAIRAYDALGQPEAALKQYRSLEKALASLGLKPSEETRALVKDSLRRERAPTPDAVASPLVQAGGTPTWVKVSSQASVESLVEASGGSGHSDNVWR